MTKSMDSWFFMRQGFTTFRLEPERHRELLFGTRERQQRDYLLGELEGASYSNDGHKAVVFGDYGRGKTHMCHNLMYEIRRRNMKIAPVYIKCSAYISKEPFYSLFSEMVIRHPTEEVSRIATEYARMVNRKEAPPFSEVVQSEDIAYVLAKGLAAVDHDAVRMSMRWLGGEPKIQMGTIGKSLKAGLSDSREFGAVMRAIAHMFVTVDQSVPLYLVDEAERFENVSNVDTFATWLASLRELTEIVGVGMMFFVGAKTRNALPTLLLQDEVIRRIGVANYVEFQNPSRDELRAFLVELLATLIRKGEVPEAHRAVLPTEALDQAIPADLLGLVGGAGDKLEAYPFEPDAFSDFIEQVAGGDLSSKPSEVLIRLQKAAQRAMRQNSRTIGSDIVHAIGAEGF